LVNWDQWQTLLAVSRSGTYAKAALILQVNATTIGRRLKLLEQQLNYPLFFRQEGRLHPTYQCETLIAHLESASEILRAAEQESISSESSAIWRDVRMTAPPFLVKYLFASNILQLTKAHRVRVELMGTGTNVSLSRREADVAIRIEDRRPPLNTMGSQVEAKRIGAVRYAVYCRHGVAPRNLPWAGLMEDFVRTTGSDAMAALAGSKGFRFRAYHFDVLAEIATSGAARAMLPCVVGKSYPDLRPVSNIVLEQPLWMLSHRQDRDVGHLKGLRSWAEETVLQALSCPP